MRNGVEAVVLEVWQRARAPVFLIADPFLHFGSVDFHLVVVVDVAMKLIFRNPAME